MRGSISFTVLLLIILSALAMSVVSQGSTSWSDWSQWTCFNMTIASRSRTMRSCTLMNFTDPVTNMITTNTTCDDLIEIGTRDDVVSANTWSSWAPVVQCSATQTVIQNRTSSCQMANPECSRTDCTGGRTTERTISIPLCCEQQNFSDWTSWSPGCSSSAPVQQTREQIPLPCDQNIQCEPDCSNIVETRIIAQTSWGDWGEWNSEQVPMCGTEQRSRQRMCINTTIAYCEIDCTLGSTNVGYQCCVVPNIWSTWSAWSQPTTTGPCPATRTRTRVCTVNTSVDASLPTCDGTCVLDSMDRPDIQQVDTARCNVNGTLATSTVCSSNSSTSIPSRNDEANDDNDNVIVTVFISLFVIAVAINILLVIVIALLVKRHRNASYSPHTPGHTYEAVNAPKPPAHSPDEYETPVATTKLHLGRNADSIQMQENPSYDTVNKDGSYM